LEKDLKFYDACKLCERAVSPCQRPWFGSDLFKKVVSWLQWL